MPPEHQAAKARDVPAAGAGNANFGAHLRPTADGGKLGAQTLTADRGRRTGRCGYTRGGVYVSMSHLRIPPHRADELVAAFRDRVGLVDGFDGFEGLEVWRSDREPGEVIMVSRWRDRACFRDYMRSEAHRVSHERIPADLQAAIKLERLDHLHTYDVVAR